MKEQGEGSDVKMAELSKYIFTAPSWPRSLVIIILLGMFIDAASLRSGSIAPFFGTFAFSVPGILATLLTRPLLRSRGKMITWNRSALLAAAGTVFAVIIAIFPVALGLEAYLPLSFAIAMGFVFAVRLLVLAAIADYHLSRVVLPALLQSGFGIVVTAFFFGPGYLALGAVLHLVFGFGCLLFIRVIERPLNKGFNISALNFVNTFIEHMTDGSKRMEDFFREIGEEVTVPQVTVAIAREGRGSILFTVPNVHPGPMGEIGGGNLTKRIHDAFSEEVLTTHGCSTHDFNLVSESESEKIIAAMRDSLDGVEFVPRAGRSQRLQAGSVNVLCQPVGDALLMVSTRWPQKTEDLTFAIGMTVMAEGHSRFAHCAFVDAHNCMADVASPVTLGSKVGNDYLAAAMKGIDAAADGAVSPFRAGVAHVPVPFSRDEGIGDIGVQALVIEVEGQRTAYILFDGNNMVEGLRPAVQSAIDGLVDECEVMTSDSHVVNTISGKNPVGMHVPPEKLVPYAVEAVEAAIADLAPAKAGAASACCRDIMVFGSNRISELASTVNAMLVFIPPLSLAILLAAFLLSVIAYIVIG
ncbi:MAG: putative rane protein [Methanofollis sp.]|nr:putative rane protein [Methanofollis sp.]